MTAGRMRERGGMRAVVTMWLACVVAWGTLAGVTAAHAQGTGTTHVLIVTGLSGEPRFARAYAQSGAALVDAATTKWGAEASNVVWLAESADAHDRVRDRSTRENVERELAALAGRAGVDDLVLVILFGHGSYQGGETRINLPGPDINGAELAALLEPLRARQVAVVNTASASGGFIQDLAADGRVVITATKSGMEQNETVFGTHFTAALTGDAADVNQDDRITLLEAFEYARREVEREYERDNRLLTEHAVIDAVGDGTGVASAESGTAHGRAASAFIFGQRGAAAGANASPELRALYETRDRLQEQLDALRGRQAGMPPAEYEAALETLLLDIARNAQAIRRMEGGST